MKEKFIRWIIRLIQKNNSHLFPTIIKRYNIAVMTYASNRSISPREFDQYGVRALVIADNKRDVEEEILGEMRKKIVIRESLDVYGNYRIEGKIHLADLI